MFYGMGTMNLETNRQGTSFCKKSTPEFQTCWPSQVFFSNSISTLHPNMAGPNKMEKIWQDAD